MLAHITLKEEHPCVILLHGLTGPKFQYCSLAEKLSENGYVVVAPEHAFDTSCLIYPEGKPVIYKLGAPPKDTDFMLEFEKWTGYLTQRVIDTNDVLVPFLRNNTLLNDYGIRIDFSKKFSLVGHSFGSAEAVELAKQYPDNYSSICCHDLWMYPNSSEVSSSLFVC